jgi:hypothetical protein
MFDIESQGAHGFFVAAVRHEFAAVQQAFCHARGVA